MEPIYSIDGIEQKESRLDYQHIIILLIIKPSDKNADEFISKLNYWHHLSDKYCSIYMIGYAKHFEKEYSDIVRISGCDNSNWEYSDTCFIDVCKQLNERIRNWKYSGEPEIIILQNRFVQNNKNKSALDFSNYHYVDVNYGLEMRYIDSVPRFMERLINASKSEVEAKSALVKGQMAKISSRRIFEIVVENTPKLPKPFKKVLKDAAFFKSYRTKK